MIPLKLQLKNFLSYGSQTQIIDFGPYHLICLSGKNGHGKSALLDALTWSVWGQGRKVLGIVKADEGLLRLGQTGMAVVFEFISHGQMYRVRREFSFINGKSYSQLDFGIIDSASNQCKPLTDKTIRGTQERIINTIGLDYDGFINSVFLRQGQSNEFSKKSPKDRKEVLASILGLDRYEQLRKRAFEKIRKLQTDKEVHITVKEHLQAEIHQEPVIIQQLNETTAQLDAALCHEEELHQKMLFVDASQKQREQRSDSYAILVFSYEQLLRTINHDKDRLYQLVSTWRTVNRYQSMSTDTIQQELAIIEAQITDLQEIASRRIIIQELYLAAKQEEHTHEQRLRLCHEQKVTVVEKAIAAQEQSILMLKEQAIAQEVQYKKLILDYTEHEEALKNLQHTIINSSLQDDEYIRLERQFERRKHYYHKLNSYKNGLIKALEKAEQQEQKLTVSDNNYHCPLCEQSLSADKHSLLNQRFKHDISLVTHQIQRLHTILPELKKILTLQHTTLQELRNAREELKLLLHQEHTLKAAITQRSKVMQEEKIAHGRQNKLIRQEEAGLIQQQQQLQATVQEYTALMRNDHDYQTIKNRIQEYETALSRLGYDQATYDRLVRHKEELRQKQAALSDTLKNKTVQEQRKHEIHLLCTTLKQYKKEVALQEVHLKEYATLQSEKYQLEQEKQTVQHQLKELQKTKELLIHRKGILEHQCSVFEQRNKELAAHHTNIAHLDTLINDYQIIVQALGRDGIQALLIEDAIPEIEQEANMLLGQLTDNQAHLSIESLRDLKSGGTKETLDIKISDALGIRPYELFSGGEAFRIDFALRIAISKLLARRAGTSLQTLIIDEGFGSQDEEGLVHIMDALHKIQDHFLL